MKIIYSVVVIILLISASRQGFILEDNYYGNTFFDHFNFVTYDDPTHGFVDYISQNEAFGLGLARVNPNGQVYIGADTTNNVQPGQRGRKSVRLESKKGTFRGGLYLLDLDHMPEGCGTWPAYWMCGQNWPNNGEIDIVEGVNNQNINYYTLHTRDGCTMNPDLRNDFAGQWNYGSAGNPAVNCYINAPNQYNNQGCSIAGGNYGSSLNQQNGGVIATYWDQNNFIKIWNFPRNAIPSDISSGNPDPNNWGKPMAYFQLGAACTPDHFNQMQIIINLTFCGDWAGDVFGQMCQGKGSCRDYVAYNPRDFQNAYWLINSLKVYTNQNNQEQIVQEKVELIE